jgi:hypothetical protein
MEFNVFEYFKDYKRTSNGPMTPEEQGTSYAKVSPQQELTTEQELQRTYERIWLPPPVKHSPWD